MPSSSGALELGRDLGSKSAVVGKSGQSDLERRSNQEDAMFRRWVPLILILFFVVGASAGDPWKDKSYKEWDEKDVRKIMTDSPWAKPVVVTATWSNTPSEGRAPISDVDSQQVAGAPGGASGAIGAPSPTGVGPGPGDSGSQYARLQYLVRWISARTVLQARARLAFLKGAPEAEVQKILNEPVTEHQLMVLGDDMGFFLRTDEMSLKAKSFLKPKKTKQKLLPSRVELIRSGDGKRVAAVILHFPLKLSSGEPAVAPDEKGVEFECRAGVLVIQATFEPRKMVRKEGPDL
jgi:hypothetical protein